MRGTAVDANHGHRPARRVDRLQRRRVVQRSEIDERAQLGQRVVVQQHRRTKGRAAVDDAMADRRDVTGRVAERRERGTAQQVEVVEHQRRPFEGARQRVGEPEWHVVFATGELRLEVAQRHIGALQRVAHVGEPRGVIVVSAERLRWLKVAAALLPVLVLMAPFLAWYAMISWRLFAFVALFLAAGLAASAVIQVWTGVPGQARDLRARHKQNMMVNLVESFSGIGWGIACYFAITGMYAWIAAGAALGLAGPVTAWFAGRMRRRD